jgi:uridine kinase
MHDSIRIIGIAGPSGSGKTMLAKELANALGPDQAGRIAMDWYYGDQRERPPHERGGTNFDHPDAMDWPLLRHQLDRLTRGQRVYRPVYSFITHCRTDPPHLLRPARLLILEGLHALHDPAIREMLALKVYVEADELICLDRRIARDVIERGRSAPAVREQYHQYVAPMYRKYVRPTREHADLVVPGDGTIEAAVGPIIEAIRTMGLLRVPPVEGRSDAPPNR